jgi:hypothetical protein
MKTKMDKRDFIFNGYLLGWTSAILFTGALHDVFGFSEYGFELSPITNVTYRVIIECLLAIAVVAAGVWLWKKAGRNETP